MDPILAGSAISAGAGIFQNIFNNAQTNRNNRINEDFWNKQNEYNHPKNQIKRLKEAGLNPFLAYGSHQSGGTAAPAPQQNQNSIDLEQIGNVMSLYLDLKQKDKAIEMQGKDIELRKEELQRSKHDTKFSAWMSGEAAGDTGVYEPDAYGHGDMHYPKVQEFWEKMKNMKADLNLSEQDIKNKKLSEKHSQFDLDQKERMEFIDKATRERYDKYDILPDDGESVQMLKIVARDIFGMKWDDFRTKILGFLPNMK